MYPKNIGCTDGRWHGSTGISPSRGSRATLPIACDASPPESRLHARAVAVRESHYPVGSLSPVSLRDTGEPLPLRVLVSVARSVKIQEVVAHCPHGSLPTDRILSAGDAKHLLYCREYSARLSLSKEPVSPDSFA